MSPDQLPFPCVDCILLGGTAHSPSDPRRGRHQPASLLRRHCPPMRWSPWGTNNNNSYFCVRFIVSLSPSSPPHPPPPPHPSLTSQYPLGAQAGTAAAPPGPLPPPGALDEATWSSIHYHHRHLVDVAVWQLDDVLATRPPAPSAVLVEGMAANLVGVAVCDWEAEPHVRCGYDNSEF